MDFIQMIVTSSHMESLKAQFGTMARQKYQEAKIID